MNVRWGVNDDLFDQPTAAPPVFGEEVTEEPDEDEAGAATLPPGPDLTGDLSDMSVYVPAHPGTDGGETTVRFELRHTSENKLAVPAFTNTEQLVAQLGTAQPWLSLTMEKLQALINVMGIDIISIDPEVSPETGKWTEEDLREFEE